MGVSERFEGENTFTLTVFLSAVKMPKHFRPGNTSVILLLAIYHFNIR